jgi:hypothetical protein
VLENSSIKQGNKHKSRLDIYLLSSNLYGGTKLLNCLSSSITSIYIKVCILATMRQIKRTGAIAYIGPWASE